MITLKSQFRISAFFADCEAEALLGLRSPKVGGLALPVRLVSRAAAKFINTPKFENNFSGPNRTVGE